MMKWALGIAKTDMEIIEVDESRERIVELSEQYKRIPSCDGAVCIFRANFDADDNKIDNKMEIYEIVN